MHLFQVSHLYSLYCGWYQADFRTSSTKTVFRIKGFPSITNYARLLVWLFDHVCDWVYCCVIPDCCMWATPGIPLGTGYFRLCFRLFYYAMCHSVVDHSVVGFYLFSAVSHSEVDHSVVGFQCFFELVLPVVGFLLLVGNGGLWVCPY